MGAAIALRADFAASDLRRLAKASRDAAQSRRLVALAEIYDGGRRTDAARIGGVGLQVIRDWVLHFNADGPNGLIDRKAPGNPSKLNDRQRRALAAIVDQGPIPAIHGVVRWRLKDLAQWIWDEFRISLAETTVSRELKAMGFVKMTARPRHHAQNELVLEDFKKTSPPHWRRSAADSRLASRSSFGGRTKRGSARRTSSPGAGHAAEAGPGRRMISAPNGPISSAPFARPKARPPA